MKRSVVLVLLVLGAVGVSFAGGGCPTIHPNCNSVPEIDPGSVGTAAALVCGILLMTRRKLKR